MRKLISRRHDEKAEKKNSLNDDFLLLGQFEFFPFIKALIVFPKLERGCRLREI